MASKKQLTDLDLTGNKVTNLAVPADDNDAATKKYVDDNAGGALSYRVETANAQTVSFTDDSVAVEGSVTSIYLPHDTTGYTGKQIQIINHTGNQVELIEIVSTVPYGTTTNYLTKLYDSMTFMALEYDPTPEVINWSVVSRNENATARVDDLNTTMSTNYVPYVGAGSNIDIAGNSLVAAGVIGVDDGGLVIAAGANVTPDSGGQAVTLNGGNGLDNGDGGQVILNAGLGGDTTGNGGEIAIYAGDPSVASGGNGGNVNLVYGRGDGSGNPGRIKLSKSGSANTASLSTELLTSPHDYELPDVDGTLMVDFGVADLLTAYVPYTGATSPVDLGGQPINNTSNISNVDNGMSIGITNSNIDVGLSGGEISIAAADGYGDSAVGGRVMIIAGSADYTTPGAVGNGGNVYLQVGAEGEAGGTIGKVQILKTNHIGQVDLGIDNITDTRDLQLPDADGTLLSGTGLSHITVGTTEPTSPAVGDLWVDTN